MMTKKLNLAPLKKTTEVVEKDNEEYVVLRKEKPREKHVDISVNFATTEHAGGRGGRGDGFRGGRGGDRDGFRGRGGRGRGNDRGGDRTDRNTPRGGNNQFNLVTDQFPALGGH